MFSIFSYANIRTELRSLRETCQELVLGTKQELKKAVHPDDKVKVTDDLVIQSNNC